MTVSSKVSEVSICNQALGWLGADPITSLNDNTKTAELCRLNYANLRDAVLETRTWTFATGRDVWDSTGEDAWGQGFTFKIPEKWHMILRCFREITGWSAQTHLTGVAGGVPGGTQARWVREGNEIIADIDKLWVWGLLKVNDPDSWTMLFTQAVAARIAADLCVPITQNMKLQADLWGLYEAKLSEAAVRDGQQGRNEVIGNSLLVNVRGGIGG